jgi:acetamidase/formamidase
MAMHELHATRATTVDVFDRNTAPVLTVDSGDSVVVSSLDAVGYLQPMTKPGEMGPRMFEDKRGHCLTGPIEVRGAQPGMVLEVRFTSITPGDWGWTIAGYKNNKLNRHLGVAEGPVSCLLW